MTAGESMVFTPSEGYTAGGAVTFVHGFSQIPGWGTGTYDGIAWLGQKRERPESSWGLVEAAGVAGVFAKWWGRKPSTYLIKGGVVARVAGDIAAAEQAFNSQRDTVNGMADRPTVWAVSGAMIISAFIVLTVGFELLENTGGRAFFTMVGINPRG